VLPPKTKPDPYLSACVENMQLPSFGFPLLNYHKVTLGDIPPEFLFNMSSAAFDFDN
jgi:hypothetical protein